MTDTPDIQDLIVHVNTSDLTYHPSVEIDGTVPVTLDFNDAMKVGKARLSWVGDKLLANLFLIYDIDRLSDPLFAMVGTANTDVFESENGTKYGMGGKFSVVSVLTQDGYNQFVSQQALEVPS